MLELKKTITWQKEIQFIIFTYKHMKQIVQQSSKSDAIDYVGYILVGL